MRRRATRNLPNVPTMPSAVRCAECRTEFATTDADATTCPHCLPSAPVLNVAAATDAVVAAVQDEPVGVERLITVACRAGGLDCELRGENRRPAPGVITNRQQVLHRVIRPAERAGLIRQLPGGARYAAGPHDCPTTKADNQ